MSARRRAGRCALRAAAAAILAGCAAAAGAQPPGAAGKGPPAMPVQVAEVTSGTLQARLWYSGFLAGRDRAALPAETPGRMLEMPEIGARFARGETIARLDDALQQQELLEHEANAAAQKARIAYLERETARLSKLVKNNNAALSLYEQTRAELGATRGARDAALARAARAREVIRRMRIVAPFDGVVGARQVEAGEWVKEGDPVVDFTGTGRLEIRVQVAARVLPHLALGKRLQFRLDEQTHEATLRALAPVGDAESRLFDLRLDVPADVGLPGRMVRVGAPAESPRGALLVPEDALVIRSEGAGVFVIDDAMRARRVAVRTGLSDGGLIEAAGELRAGDKVVVRGGERLRDGVPVRIVPAGGAPPPRPAT